MNLLKKNLESFKLSPFESAFYRLISNHSKYKIKNIYLKPYPNPKIDLIPSIVIYANAQYYKYTVLYNLQFVASRNKLS